MVQIEIEREGGEPLGRLERPKTILHGRVLAELIARGPGNLKEIEPRRLGAGGVESLVYTQAYLEEQGPLTSALPSLLPL